MLLRTESLHRALAQANLGNALKALGEREGGTARLEDAISAYRAASEGTNPRPCATGLGSDLE